MTLYKLLFEAHTALGFDVAVTADAGARIHLAVHGRFSLGCLALGSLPSLEFTAPPKLLAVRLASTLHALTVIVHTSAHARALLPDGTKQDHAPGTLLLAFRTGQLTRANMEIRALALSFMQCEALAARARVALETAEQLWSEAVSPLHAKMHALDTELKQAQRPGTVTEQLAMLLACGVPARPPCLQSFILREMREPELARILKAIGVAASALLQILLTQVPSSPSLAPATFSSGVQRTSGASSCNPLRLQPCSFGRSISRAMYSQAHPALDMLVQRLSHLHGLSRWPYQFAALGLQPARVASALDAAVCLRVPRHACAPAEFRPLPGGCLVPAMSTVIARPPPLRTGIGRASPGRSTPRDARTPLLPLLAYPRAPQDA